jgi:hypothetical protein
MATWSDFERARPELAAAIRGRFEQGRDHLLATIRRDGSPRISAVEVVFLDGDVQFGMVAPSRKLDDVRRDGRAALHAATLARAGETGWPGDAKLLGVVVEHPDRTDPSYPDAAQMTFDLREAAVVRVNEETGAIEVEGWKATDPA